MKELIKFKQANIDIKFMYSTRYDNKVELHDK